MNEIQNTGADRRGFWQVLTACSGTARDRKNQYKFVAWTFAWGVIFTAMSRLLKSDYELSTQVAWLAATLPVIVGSMAVLAYLHFLREADEFLQKLQFEGLATGFGISIVFALGYQLFELVGAPILRTDDVLFVMMIAWVAGQFYSVWRYR